MATCIRIQMDGVIEMNVVQESRGAGSDSLHAPPLQLEASSREAYRILHVGFTVAPIVAVSKKFTHILVNWDQTWPPGSRTYRLLADIT